MVQIARPCDKHVVCPVIEGLFFPDPDSPYANLSSEKPEPAPSPYCILHPASPLCHNPPPPVPDGGRNNCPPNIDCRIIPIPDGSCTGRNCGSDGGVVIEQDGDGTGTMPFYNTVQYCTVECPDGSSFTHTIAAGRFTSTFSQAEADANAASYCEDEANSLMICIITDTLPSACVGDLYGEQIVAEGGVPRATGNAYLWSASGLPPGLDINTVRGNIGGTPTAGGTYNVTVTATDGMNNSKSKTLVLNVIEIISGPTLKGGVETRNYGSVTLTANPSGGIWSVYSGSLPDGLSMSALGVISGTVADGIGGQTFTFGVMYELGDSVCTKNMSIKIWNYAEISVVASFGYQLGTIAVATVGPGMYEIRYISPTNALTYSDANGTPAQACFGHDWIGTMGNGLGNCSISPDMVLNPIGPIPGATYHSTVSQANAQAQVDTIMSNASPLLTFECTALSTALTLTSPAWGGSNPICGCTPSVGTMQWSAGGGTGPRYSLYQIGQP